MKDEDCPEGSHCEQVWCVKAPCFGQCKPDEPLECESDDDCGPGKYCEFYCGNGWCKGVCKDIPDGKCIDDEDCPNGFQCDHSDPCPLCPNCPCFGTCEPVEKKCESDKDCPAGFYCAFELGGSGEFDVIGGTCSPVPEGSCVKDEDCGPGGECVFDKPCPLCIGCPCFGTCYEQKECKSDDDCAKGQKCFYEGEVCVDCAPDASDCEPGCFKVGYCGYECKSDADCPEGFVCDVLKCLDNGKCLGPYKCVPM